ncbi:NAD(P)H-binding protein [Phenylobacterium sp. LjRoot219]|uniref:NAD(P)H-binding protein n=1 Tax=Phenylobacterium sp. LjRoot219 TaxID=3342283 RepID=UPI003F50266B
MIVVTAPTGNIGDQVVQNLLNLNAPVRVIVRDPTHLAKEVRDRTQVVNGSHGDAGVVNEAFSGADAVFWLTPPDPKAASVIRDRLRRARPCGQLSPDQLRVVQGSPRSVRHV